LGGVNILSVVEPVNENSGPWRQAWLVGWPLIPGMSITH